MTLVRYDSNDYDFKTGCIKTMFKTFNKIRKSYRKEANTIISTSQLRIPHYEEAIERTSS